MGEESVAVSWAVATQDVKVYPGKYSYNFIGELFVPIYM